MSTDQDRALEELLADTAAVRARLRQEHALEQPPARLDEAILAASRRAVSSRPVAVGSARRWQAPLAAAAVVVLATSVALITMQERAPERVLDSALPLTARVPEAKKAAAPEPYTPGPAQPGSSANASRLPAADHAPADRVLAQQAFPRKELADRDAPAAYVPAPAAPATGAGIPAEVARAIVAEPSPGSVDGPDLPPKATARARSAEAGAARSSDQAREATAAARQSIPREPAGDATTQSPAGELERIRKRWDEGDLAGAREALAVFLHQHPGYPLPPGFPVPKPGDSSAQERPGGNR